MRMCISNIFAYSAPLKRVQFKPKNSSRWQERVLLIRAGILKIRSAFQI